MFDLLSRLPVDILDDENAIEGPKEPQVAKKIVVWTQFKLMAYFKMALSDTIIKSHHDIQKVDAKKRVYWGKGFDSILWLLVDITDEKNDIEGLEEP